MTDRLWDELSSVAGTIERLERELKRCAGPSKYKSEVESGIKQAQIRRQEILAELQKASGTDAGKP